METGQPTLGARAAAAWRKAVNTETIRLAVTGLSRAGKTVFITSLVQNLIAMGAGARTLPALSQRLDGRLKRLSAAGDPPGGVKRFPFEANLAALADASPRWPPRTEDLASIRLTLTVARQGLAARVLPDREVTLDILDYPGEWLLDLPLMDRSYAAWSRETIERLRMGGRAELARPFLEAQAAIAPNGRPDEAAVRRAAAAYVDYLRRARDERGLRYLQPARFLVRDPDDPENAFVPLDVRPGWRAAEGTAGALMEARFEAYKANVRRDFVEPHFRRFDRQIVLVDVLGALHAGPEAFADTQLAVSRLADCFGYGGRRWYAPFAAGISKVVFAATKADHVPERQRDALQVLLSVMAGADIDDIRAKAAVKSMAVASVRCTVDDVASMGGRDVAVVRGVTLETGRSVKFFPGDVPLRPPGPEFWGSEFFALPVFQPPRLDATGAAGVPHLKLDHALDFLIGDRL